MFENPRRGRQAKHFTKNVPRILGLKSSSEQIFFRKLMSLGTPAHQQQPYSVLRSTAWSCSTYLLIYLVWHEALLLSFTSDFFNFHIANKDAQLALLTEWTPQRPCRHSPFNWTPDVRAGFIYKLKPLLCNFILVCAYKSRKA